tara:strand:+ start:65 stop:577 length:513 start_codon:yes stop_codon:yes gene_type:complete
MRNLIAVAAIVLLTSVVVYQNVKPMPVSQPLESVVVEEPVVEIQIEEPIPQFALTYHLNKELVKRFDDKEDADQLKNSLDTLGFKTRYYRWELLPSPIDNPGPFDNPFDRNGPPVYHLIYYSTPTKLIKLFDNLDSARLWQLQLRDLGCIANIEEVENVKEDQILMKPPK